MVKEVKVSFVDAYPELRKCIEDRLEGRIKFIDSDKPDYIFCSCFGHRALYEDGIRIIFIGENFTPDFNLYDYAIGFDDIQFGDRYLRFPLYAFGYKDAFEMALNKHIAFSKKDLEDKKRFCNFVVSHGRDTDMRTIFFKELCNYKKVDSCGKYLNNIGYSIGTTLEDKRNFQRQCKFTLAFENSSMKGYTTEKLIEAWAAGTIPVYWGNPDISKEFNSKAFINCHDYDSIDEVIEVIKKIDNDDERYMEMMSMPILTSDSIANRYIHDDQLVNFFENIFKQGKENAYRRTSYTGRFGTDYERDIKRRFEYDQKMNKQTTIHLIKQKVKRIVKG